MRPAPYAEPSKPLPPEYDKSLLPRWLQQSTATQSRHDKRRRVRAWQASQRPKPFFGTFDVQAFTDQEEAANRYRFGSAYRKAAQDRAHRDRVQDASNWTRWLTALHCRARAGRLPIETARANILFAEPPASARTLLVSLETSLLTSTKRCFPERSAARAAYLYELEVTARDDNDDRRVLRMRDCSTRWNVSQTPDGPRLETWRCRERLCPECQRVRAYKYQQAYEAFIVAAKRPKMLTLTIATMDAPAGEAIDKLYRCFRLLRRREVWKAHCTGGYTVVEITPGQSGLGWHVHLHILMDSVYIPVRWLSEQWFAITGDSYRVDIRVADKGTAKYVAKYATKQATPGEDGRDWWRLSDDMRGRRMAQSFGDAPALNLTVQEAKQDSTIIGTLESILYAAQQGDQAAIDIIDQLRDHYGSVPGEKPPKPDPPDPHQRPLQLE